MDISNLFGCKSSSISVHSLPLLSLSFLFCHSLHTNIWDVDNMLWWLMHGKYEAVKFLTTICTILNLVISLSMDFYHPQFLSLSLSRSLRQKVSSYFIKSFCLNLQRHRHERVHEMFVSIGMAAALPLGGINRPFV